MTAQPAPTAGRLTMLLQFLEQDPRNLQLIADAAASALDEGDLAEADRLIDAYRALSPLPPELLNLAGLVALSDGRFQEAAEAFESLRAENPNDPVLKFNLAWCRAMLRDFDAASDSLDEAAAFESPAAARLKVQMLHHLGKLDEALALGGRLADRFASDQALAGALAAAAMDAEDAPLAEVYARRAGDDAEGLATLGLLRLNDDAVDVGLELFDRALRRDPRDARALLGKGLGLLARNETELAPALIDEAAERFERHLGSWVAAGWAYFVTGDYATSRARFEKALGLDDTFAEIHGGLAVLDITEGKLESGKRRTEVALRLDRKCLSAALARSLILTAEGDPASAERVRHIALNTPIAPGGRTLAQAFTRLGATSAARPPSR